MDTMSGPTMSLTIETNAPGTKWQALTVTAARPILVCLDLQAERFRWTLPAGIGQRVVFAQAIPLVKYTTSGGAEYLAPAAPWALRAGLSR